jgi:hypothetical protein
MAISGDVLRNWAKGKKQPEKAPKAQPPKAKPGASPEKKESDDLDLLLGEDELPEEGEASHSPYWAGEEVVDDVEAAEELLKWLEENEPEIFEAVMSMASALSEKEPDEEMVQHALDELKHATQYLNPEYEPLTEEEQSAASKNIEKHMRAKGNPKKDSPEWKQAVAIGISEARAGNKDKGEESDEGEESEESEGEEA